MLSRSRRPALRKDAPLTLAHETIRETPKGSRRRPLVPLAAEPPEPKLDGPLVKTVISSLEDSKAEDIVKIDLTGKTTLADTMLIATGRSNTHVGAIADYKPFNRAEIPQRNAYAPTQPERIIYLPAPTGKS